MLMLAVLGLVLVLGLLYRGALKPKGFPPGPPRTPFVGFLPKMERHLVHKQMWRLADTYGPVVGLFFAHLPVVVVNGWEAIKESLQNDDLNGRPEISLRKIMQGGVLRGVMFVEGDFWKEQRRFSLHHFRNLGFGKRSHESVIHEEARELIDEVLDTDGSIKLQNVLGISSINILWAVMGGVRFPRKDPQLMHLVDGLNKLFRAGDVSGGLVGAFPFLRHFVSKEHRAIVVMNGFASVEKFIKKAVDEHKENLDPNNPRDFIDIYLNEINNELNNNSKKGSTFSEKQLIAVCTDVFSAGAETGSATVAFAVMLMCLFPEVMRKVQKEIDSVIGQNRLPSMADRTDLPYLEATLTEVFRFRGAAPFTVPHSALRDTVLQGYRIPAKTMVMNNLYSVHMDPEHWGDPENFRPERFINTDGTFRKDERMIPFGKGRRLCLGEPLARMTSFLLFAALVQHLDFELDPAVPVTNTEGIAGFTLGPPEFRVFAKRRH
ncbi:methyl farnesoate epoxidase-like [Penaeus japonicus]|uniref:methyl farnesoate epoxidase-like n=1 Tax=Penaeus japonicus TaxID=27405 RepID=UPI001C70CC16|nr:methyl farnesoate epoxidase-like [Penaeus japonicus]